MIEKKEFTKYEIARILGARALQLAMDAPVLLKLSEKELDDINYDVLKIAELEFEQEVLPIDVKRPFPKKRKEKIKKLTKAELEEKMEKQSVEQDKKEKEDKKIEIERKKEVEEIKEEGEIMELAKPEDEIE